MPKAIVYPFKGDYIPTFLENGAWNHFPLLGPLGLSFGHLYNRVGILRQSSVIFIATIMDYRVLPGHNFGLCLPCLPQKCF